MDRIIVFDTTLRDGEQSPGASLNVRGEAGDRPAARAAGGGRHRGRLPHRLPGDFDAVQRIAREVHEGATVCGLARRQPRATSTAPGRRCAEAPPARASTSSSPPPTSTWCTSSSKSREEVLEIGRQDGGARPGLHVDDVEFSPMDATRADPEFLYEMLAAVIEAGATTVNIPDTVGYAIPGEFGELIRGIMQNVPNIEQAVICVHCHNDLGLAVANSLAAVAGRRPPGGVHHQRHRRAGRQRLAGRGRHGAQPPATTSSS